MFVLSLVGVLVLGWYIRGLGLRGAGPQGRQHDHGTARAAVVQPDDAVRSLAPIDTAPAPRSSRPYDYERED